MLDRSIAPLASDIERPNLPGTEELILQKDLPLIVLNQGNQPVVFFEMVIPVGRWEESVPDLTYYTFKMLTEGTQSKTSETIASAFDFFGSHLEITPTLDGVSLKLYALNKFFPQILELLIELLTESAFPEKEFDTLKQIRIQSIKQEHAQNNSYANLKFRELIFGAAHPYGFMTNETLTSKVSIEEVIQNKKALRIKPLLFVSGLVDDTILHAIKKNFEHFPFEKPLLKRQSDTFPLSKQETISREDSTQASLRIGSVSIDRHHTDFHHLKVANELLGGFFGSRLMKNIREDKGLTYGIRSGFVHLQEASYWTISSELLRDKLELGQSEIYKEINRLKTEVPSQKEFDTVINYMKGKFLSSFDSPFSSHTMIKGLRTAGLTENYFYEYFNTLQTIQPEQICEVLKQYVLVDRMTNLVVV